MHEVREVLRTFWIDAKILVETHVYKYNKFLEIIPLFLFDKKSNNVHLNVLSVFHIHLFNFVFG